VDVRIGREGGNSITGMDASLKETIRKVLYPLCPYKQVRTYKLDTLKPYQTEYV
jgi:hypothetical protein